MSTRDDTLRHGDTASATAGDENASPPGAGNASPTPWHRNPRLALIGIIVTTVIATGVGFLGPSAVAITVGPRSNLLPPWYLPGRWRPNEWLVCGVLWVTVIVGAGCTWIALRAIADGWRPRNKRLIALGVLLNTVISCTLPMTSADVLMYAAYGRLAKLGIDPYAVTPAEVYRMQWDPILRWTERPWQDTPSVYGPVIVATQWVANMLGGDNAHNVIFWLQMVCLVSTLATCLVAIWMARFDQRLQTRVIMLTILCPPMIWAITAGAHNETAALFFGMLGFACLRKRPFWAGFLIAFACCGKATIGIFGLALIWAYRRQLKNLALGALGAAIPAGAYVLLFPTSIKLAVTNSGYIANTSWAQPVKRVLEPFLGFDTTKQYLGLLAWVFCIVLAWMLSRVLPWRPAPGLPEGQHPEHDPLTIALRTSTLIGAAFLATTMYSLPWYDIVVFAPMALIGATRLDLIMLWRVTVLNFAYVAGRVIGYGKSLQITENRIREVFGASVAIGIVVAIVLWWHEHGLQTGSHVRGPHTGDETDEQAKSLS